VAAIEALFFRQNNFAFFRIRMPAENNCHVSDDSGCPAACFGLNFGRELFFILFFLEFDELDFDQFMIEKCLVE